MENYSVFDLATIIPIIDPKTGKSPYERWVIVKDGRFVKYFREKEDAEYYCYCKNNKIKINKDRDS